MLVKVAVCGVLVAGVLVPGSAGAQGSQGPLTVYSSLPLSGAATPQSRAVVRGARLALEEAGGSAGGRQIRYVSLNDATRRAGTWAPERVAANARRAAQDGSTIAYIGEFNSGATAISLPILNEADVPQISPSNSAVGLTRGGPATERGEPAKYYPTGRRTYFRLAPNDRVQAAALAGALRDHGCRRVALLHDGELYGKGIATLARRTARRIGLNVVATRRISRSRSANRRLARRLRARRAGCVAYGGITANGAVGMFRAVGGRLPKAQLFGSDGIAEAGFTRRLPAKIARRMQLTVGTLAPSGYPAAGQDFFGRYSARYGDPTPDPYAVYGYEAMRVVLDAINGGALKRRALVDALRVMPERDSALGRYRFDRNGDTTSRRYGLYGIDGGALVFAGAITAP